MTGGEKVVGRIAVFVVRGVALFMGDALRQLGGSVGTGVVRPGGGRPCRSLRGRRRRVSGSA